MRRNMWQNAVLILIVFAIGILACVAVISSKTHAGHVDQLHQTNCASEDCGSHPREPFWERATDDPVAFFTLVLTAFTGVLAWCTLFLWRATERLVRSAEATAEKQLRAYVMIVGGRLVNPVTDGNDLIAELELKNCGQTPALNYRQWSTIFITDPAWTGPVPTYRIPPDQPTRPIAASGIATVTTPPIGPLTAEQATGITHKQVKVWVVGGCIYDDIFGIRRSTTFFLFLDDVRGTPMLQAYKDGNAAD